MKMMKTLEREEKNMPCRIMLIILQLFVRRVIAFVKLFFRFNGLNSEWHWYKYEWQKRGNIHVHGLAILVGDPSLSNLAEVVAIGRKAESTDKYTSTLQRTLAQTGTTFLLFLFLLLLLSPRVTEPWLF